MVAELLGQLEAERIGATHIYLGTGSCGTHSGTLAGVTASGSTLTVQGVSVSRPESLQREKVIQLANETLRHLGLPEAVEESRVLVDDRFRGPGYGIPTEQTMEAIEIGAREEALLLDPVYTGKAMAGLIAHAREGRFSAGHTVIFLHTGGAPALFAYHDEVAGAIRAPA
jgi:D-cysteine desulfhydrase